MNAIASRIADFLKEHLPFSNLSFDELTQIATNIRVINLEKIKHFFKLTINFTIVFMS